MWEKYICVSYIGQYGNNRGFHNYDNQRGGNNDHYNRGGGGSGSGGSGGGGGGGGGGGSFNRPAEVSQIIFLSLHT